MNGKQTKTIRKTAQLIWQRDVQPAAAKIMEDYTKQDMADPAVLKNVQEQMAELPSPRKLYRRLKTLYTRRARGN